MPVRGKLTVEMVRHPGAAAILPLLDPSTILLIRQYRPVVGGWLWEIPAGTLEPDESPIECARRELLEETGYHAASIAEVGLVYPVPDFSDDLIHVFVAQNLSFQGRVLENDELIENVPTSLAQAIEMIRRGEIIDGKTLISILLLARLGLGARLPMRISPDKAARHATVSGRRERKHHRLARLRPGNAQRFQGSGTSASR